MKPSKPHNAPFPASPSASRFAGFPRGVRSIGVPAPLFGELLAQIDSLAELKCTLRMIWLLQQKKGSPRFVSLSEARADRTLGEALASGGNPSISDALDACVRRGSLGMAVINGADGAQERLFTLNIEADRRAMARLADDAMVVGNLPSGDTPQPWSAAEERPNIFALYEANIGMLSPMLAEELKDAEMRYPVEWIEDALREAAAQNRRSWRYIARILERWEREGKSGGAYRGGLRTGVLSAGTEKNTSRNDGRTGRYSKKVKRY